MVFSVAGKYWAHPPSEVPVCDCHKFLQLARPCSLTWVQRGDTGQGENEQWLWTWLGPFYLLCVCSFPELRPSSLLLCRAISSQKQQRSMFSLPQPTLSLPQPTLPVSYSTTFLPHSLQMHRRERAASPYPGKDECAALEKVYLQLFGSVGGLHRDVLGIHGSKTHFLHTPCSSEPSGGT